MSVLSELDNLILRETSNPPNSTKGSALAYSEFDGNFIKFYNVVQSVVSGENVTAYDPAATYDAQSTDVYQKYASYDNRIWKVVYTGSPTSFSGVTPEEGSYWTQITLAELLPNIMSIVQWADSLDEDRITSSEFETAWMALTNQDLNSNPVDLIDAPGAGKAVIPTMLLFQLGAGAAAYDFGATGLHLVYSTNTGEILAQIAQSDINSVTDVNAGSTVFTNAGTDFITSDKLQLYAAADATQGTGIYYVKLFYKVIDTAI